MHPIARTVAAALVAVTATPVLAEPRLLFKTDFNDKPVDQLLAARGPAFNEPVGNDSGYVRHAPFDSPHLEILDTSTCCAQATVFEFWNYESIATGTIDFRANIYFETIVDNYILSLREQGSSAVSFLNTYARRPANAAGNGNLLVIAGDRNSGLLSNPGYPVGRWVPLRVSYSPNLKRVRMEIDGKPIFDGNFNLNAAVGVGRFYFASENIAGTSGSVIRVDDVRVTHCDSATFGDCLFDDGFD